MVGMPGFSECHFERGLHPGGDLEGPLYKADPTGQFRRLRWHGGRQAHRAGVGSRSREGPQADDSAHAQPLHQIDHAIDE